MLAGVRENLSTPEIVENSELSCDYDIVNQPIISSQDLADELTTEVEDKHGLFGFKNMFGVLFDTERNKM